MMPAGYGRTCEDCYWHDLFHRRLSVSLNAIGSASISDTFSQFASWLLEETGPQKAALGLNRHLDFFIEMDRQWGTFPSHGELISHFGTPRLRKQRLVDRWMLEQEWVEPAREMRENDLENRRIRSMLECYPEQSHQGRLLSGYHMHLLERLALGRITPRSMRMNLRSACRLLEVANEGCSPDQRALNQFLSETPGQRAAITGFIGYLRERHRLELSVASRDITKRSMSKCRERRILQLLEREKAPSTDSWIRAALAFFHGLSDNQLGRGPFEVISRDAEFWLVRIKQIDYWVPALPETFASSDSIS